MLRVAREIEPTGDYRPVEDGDLSQFNSAAYDLVLSAFTFDNIPTMQRKVDLFAELGRLLKREGRIVNVVSSPEIYTHEWASFSTENFPENRNARSGDTVKIVVTDTEDKRPFEDILWTDEAYREVYGRAGLGLVDTYRPLARGNEPYAWVNETKIPPWVIYVLRSAEEPRAGSGQG